MVKTEDAWQICSLVITTSRESGGMLLTLPLEVEHKRQAAVCTTIPRSQHLLGDFVAQTGNKNMLIKRQRLI